MNASNNHYFNGTKKYCIIGAPQSKGAAEINKAVVHFPATMKETGIVDILKTCDADVEDWGDAFPRDDLEGEYETPEYAQAMDKASTGDARYIMNCHQAGKSQYLLYEKVKSAVDQNIIPLILGGDHGIATGSIAGSLQKYPNLVIVFIDAHTDLNTLETSIHGRYSGMPLAHLCGHFKVQHYEWLEKVPNLNPKNIIYIGLRELFTSDYELIEKYGCVLFTMNDVAKYGIGKVMEMGFAQVDPEGTAPIHLSFDVDGCDPYVAPGSSAKMEGGLSHPESMYIAKYLNETNRVVSMDINEINADHDIDPPYTMVTRIPYKVPVKKTVQLAIHVLVNLTMGKGIIPKKKY